MALPAENILQALFETKDANAAADQLKQLVADEPYFGAARFLLAKNLFNEKQDGYGQALQQAALHFQDELFLHFSLNQAEEPVSIPVLEIQPSISTPAEVEFTDEETDEDFDETDEPQAEETPEDTVFSNKLSNILKEQAAAFEKPVEPAEEIPVEVTAPHRIDYFESQGIKLEDEKNDKLGSQLRRFTDWLKQMKSINPNPTELKTDAEGETQVQNIALHSNETEEVVTETMAEVLVKQGKPEQAIKIYEKLSFINPSKSSYFAAKIEEIKVR